MQKKSNKFPKTPIGVCIGSFYFFKFVLMLAKLF